jgi:hypothetical protein
MMKENSSREFGQCGLTIQQAMVEQATHFPPEKGIPLSILWDGLRIQTSDVWDVPSVGVLRAAFLHVKSDVEQGFDLRLPAGWLLLQSGDRVSHLRTWKNERFEDAVEYAFHSRDRLLWVWNVYKMRFPGGQVREEQWTDNAGFWIEAVSEQERIYHCSHGQAYPPDFDSLVFKVVVESSKAEEPKAKKRIRKRK